MAVAAPERTYAIDPEDQPRPASQEPARGPAALASEPRARRRRDRDADDATDERQVGLGNGYLDAERQPDRDARDRAEQAREETRRSGEPEYARSVKIEEPERGQTTRPITQKPEAVGEAEALKNENAKDDADAAALKEEKPITEGEEGAEKEDEEEGEQEGEDVLDELKGEEEEEAEATEEASEEGGAGGAAAPALAPGVLAAQTATARLSSAAGVLMQATQTPASFAPHPDELSPISDVASAGAAKRRASESLAADFIARNGHHAEALLGLASTAPSRIFAAAEASKALVDASVAQNIATVTGAIGGAIAAASQQAAAAKALVEAQRAVSLVVITTTTLGARMQVETEFAAADTELTSLETSQKTSISASYRTWEPRFKNVGAEIGREAMGIAQTRANQWLAQRNGESSILDGPIHDNRLEARADAAKSVAKEYQKEFTKIAEEQAGQIIGGEGEVITYITDSAKQARDGLTAHRDAIVEALDTSSTQALDQSNSLADQMLQSIDSSLATTHASLGQQLVAQVARLQEYALTQKTAIDDQAGQAVAALLDGGAAAIEAFGQSMREFLESAVGMQAPDSEEAAPALADAQAQTDTLAATMLGQMEQGIAASEQGVTTGGTMASEAINQLGQSAVEQAQATADGYAASIATMRQQAVEGFTNLRTGHQETADAVKASATEGFTSATTSLRDAFSTLSKTTVENFEKAREQMRVGLRGTFPDMRQAIEKQADDAAAAVQPRWKSVLKWVITIVVIIAVVALTIVSAGSLGVVGTILLGAALGAAAGAATTIGHNLVDGKKWSDGVAKAMVIGAIGGAFGGVGGALAGKVASTGLKFAIEAGVDVVGGVVGDLAVGNPLTIEGVLFGAAIGAGVGAGVGIAGALKGKIKIGKPTASVSAPKVEVSVAPVGPKSKTRSFLEKTTILKKTPDVNIAPPAPKAKPPAGGGAPPPKPDVAAAPPVSKSRPEVAPPPKSTPEAAKSAPPPPKVTPDATAPKAKDASSPTAAEKPAPPKGSSEPAPTSKPADEGAAGKGSEPTGKAFEVDEPGIVAKRKTPDGHEIKITESGQIVRCTTCALHPYRDVLDNNPGLAQKLDDVQKRLLSKNAATRKAALVEFDSISDELEKQVKAAKAAAAPGTVAAPAKPTPGDKSQLSGNGRFKDANLEGDYKRYVERKEVENARARANGEPEAKVRKRLDWQKASDWWKNNSPIARGNRFNAKARKAGEYDYHEVHLENGKRVDSYTKPSDPDPGLIVSRKATDLNMIDTRTFMAYLDELIDKYKPGTKVNSPKYGDDFGVGEKLKGQMILEVPDNAANRLAAKYRGFEELAKAKKIEIRFAKE